MKISLNIKLDKEVYVNFREGSVGGVDFGKKIRNAYPDLNLDNHDEYIEHFYAEHADDLETIVKETEQCFKDVEKPLFSELQKYFGSYLHK